MNKSAPIGIFDSGVGGISVAKSVRVLLPHESLIYVADSHHAPYGDRSNAFIESRALHIAHYLAERGVKAILVACNTATVVAIGKLRAEFDIPIIGMEPGIKPAVQITRTGVIGVLATSRTVKSAMLRQLIDRHATSVRIELQACPGLVEQVEVLDLHSNRTRKLLLQFIKPLLEVGADTLVLGCTHYVFLRDAIQELVGDSVSLVSTNEAVAAQLRHQLLEKRLLSTKDRLGLCEFHSTGLNVELEYVVSQLWDSSVRIDLAAELTA